MSEQTEGLFNERETMMCERVFCVVLDGRIVIGIRSPFGIAPNIVGVLIRIHTRPPTLRRYQTEWASEGMASGKVGIG
jgi:hypothetical protein